MGCIPIFQRKVSSRTKTKEKELRKKNKMCILFVKLDSSKCNIYNRELSKQGFAHSYKEKNLCNWKTKTYGYINQQKEINQQEEKKLIEIDVQLNKHGTNRHEQDTQTTKSFVHLTTAIITIVAFPVM